jgi:hypothetical protein
MRLALSKNKEEILQMSHKGQLTETQMTQMIEIDTDVDFLFPL